MTDVRRLAARLNPATPNLTGSGGIPEWTQQDIAAALAMLRDGEGEPLDHLAREVFCACWAPDFAKLTHERLMREIAHRQYTELRRQRRELADLQAELVAARDFCNECGYTEANTQELRFIENRMKTLERGCWSIRYPEMFERVRNAVMSEVSRPNQCTRCKGRMSTWKGSLQVKCPRCAGRGTLPVSDRERARRIMRDESSYRREWHYLYEFTYGMVADAEASALVALRVALGMDERANIRGAFGAAGATETEPATAALVSPH